MSSDILSHARLQPLRVPAPWHVKNNKFYEVDPDPGPGAREGFRQLFEATLFWAVCGQRHCGLDLGWSPAWEPSGHYVLTLVHWGRPRHPGGTMPKQRIRVRRDGFTYLYELQDTTPPGGEGVKGAWRDPAYLFETRSRAEVVARVEDIMSDVAAGGAHYIPRHS